MALNHSFAATRLFLNIVDQRLLLPIQLMSSRRCYCEDKKQVKLGGFAKAFDKFSSLDHIPAETKEKKNVQNFASLLRHSKFMSLGDPRGKVVEGRVFHVVEDDLYIDIGSKFHVVCQKPSKGSQHFVRGAVVRLRLLELELSSRFLGSSVDMTLLEADAKLLGLVNSPNRRQDRGIEQS